MFELTAEDGSALDPKKVETIFILIELMFPASLGGQRNWVVGNTQGLRKDGTGVIFDVYNPVSAVDPPKPSANDADEQRFSITLADTNRTWKNLLKGKFAGTRVNVMYKWKVGDKLSKPIYSMSGEGLGEPSHSTSGEDGYTTLVFFGGFARLGSWKKAVMSKDFIRGKDSTDNAGDLIESSQEIRAGSSERSRRLT